MTRSGFKPVGKLPKDYMNIAPSTLADRYKNFLEMRKDGWMMQCFEDAAGGPAFGTINHKTKEIMTYTQEVSLAVQLGILFGFEEGGKSGRKEILSALKK